MIFITKLNLNVKKTELKYAYHHENFVYCFNILSLLVDEGQIASECIENELVAMTDEPNMCLISTSKINS